MNYALRVMKIAECMVPGPLSLYMSHWDELEYAPHFIWLVEGGGKNILINTGLPQDPADLEILNAACRASHPMNFFAPDRIWRPQDVLADVGVKPEVIDVILITALGAYATGGIELFPNAEIYLSRAGWIDFLAPSRPPMFHREVVLTDATMTYLYTRAWDRLHLVGDEKTILPGIRMFWVGGHHRGSMAVAIETTQGNVVISDTIFRYENFDPGIPIGVVENLFEAQDALERIRHEADIVIPTHDNEVLRRYPDGVIASGRAGTDGRAAKRKQTS